MTFQEAVKKFKNDEIRELAEDSDGLRFLKLRSLSRKEKMTYLAKALDIDVEGVAARDLLEFLYNQNIPDDEINKVVRELYTADRRHRAVIEDKLIAELYRVAIFDWGGLHQNSLEKTIVDNYVKKIRSFDELQDSIDNELHTSLRGYVVCSWYNHWTSIIIEDIFKEHESVLPAVGLTKKIDFFLSDIPFDLKVTYLPESYVSNRRKEAALRPELTVLRQVARRSEVPINTNLSRARLLENLWSMVRDVPNDQCQGCIAELSNFRDTLISQIKDNPEVLIRWLYENQGVRRFDASNRLFLILVNSQNHFESWKLKRARPLLAAGIHRYLDDFSPDTVQDVPFLWEGTEYRAISDIVLVEQ